MYKVQLLGTSIFLSVNMNNLKQFDCNISGEYIDIDKYDAITYFKVFHPNEVSEFILTNIKNSSHISRVEFGIIKN